ncbi:MAG: PAS domain S-box protein [Magnetospirillum sp. WYHS-4]
MNPIIRGMTIRYGLVLFGLALLTFGSHLLLANILDSERTSAAELNLAGRQRMLSQRIGLLGMELDRLSEGPLRAAVRAEYRQALDQMDRSHRILVQGDPTLGILPPRTEALHTLYFGPRRFLDRDVVSFLDQARQLFEEHAVGVPSREAGHDHAEDFAILAFGRLLDGLEEATSQHQADSEERLQDLARLQDATLGAILLVLVLSAFAVFRPTVTRLAAHIREITEVQESLRKLSRAVEESPTSIVITDAHARIEYVNPKFCELTGYTMAEILGQNPSILKSGNTPAAAYGNMWRALRAGQEWHGEFLNRRKDGTTFWEMASISPIKDAAGSVTHFVAVKEDITVRKAMEHSLRAARAEYDSLLTSIRAGVNKIDLEGSVTFANAAHDAMFGLPPGGSLGLKVWDFVDAAERPAMLEMFRRVIAEHPEPTPYVAVFRRTDGTEMVVQTDWGYELGAAGDVMGFVSVMNDITDRRRAEVQLQEAKEEAERANNAKSEFLSRMSHELRTPLNAIIGFGQLLEYNPNEPLTEKQKSSVAYIVQGGHHLLELINEILDLAKIEAGHLELSLESVAVAPLVADCLPLIQPRADERHITVRVAADQGRVVRADHTRLKQVLLNLMSNAVKYNRDGGAIDIFYSDAPNGLLRIAVADTGPGIPEEHQGEVFQPFNRLGAEGSTVEGTGIGLTITRRLIEAMGGRIGFASKPGEGTTFWVEVPTADALASAEAAPESEAGAGVGTEPHAWAGARVLYVEDNPTNVELMQIFLAGTKGFHLLVAVTAEEGLDMARRERPDIILMDVNLPGMSGVEAVRRLKADPETRGIPVIAVSAAAMPRDVEAGVEAGFDSYLTKPINLREVLKTIHHLLANRASVLT